MLFSSQLHFSVTHHELNHTKTLFSTPFPFHLSFFLSSFIFAPLLIVSSHFSTTRDGLKLHRSPLISWTGERWAGTSYCLFLWSVLSCPLLGGNYTNALFSPFPITHPELSDGSQLLSSPFPLVSWQNLFGPSPIHDPGD